MKKILWVLLLSLYTSYCFAQFNYPIARTEPFDTVIYGKKISDPYFWMSRTANKKEMLEFSRAQANLTLSLLDSIPGTEILLGEWDKAYASLQDELWALKAVGSAIYYNRDIPGEGAWLCKRASANGPEEKILSKVIINGKKYSIKKKAFAYKLPLVALMLIESGEANPHIRIFDMDKKVFLPDSIGPVMFNDSRGVSMVWMPDDKGLLYTQAPPTTVSSEIYYNGKIKLHVTGTDPKNDEAIFGSGINPAISLSKYETPYVYSFTHSPYIIARIRSAENENYAYAVHYSKINGKSTPWKRLKNYTNMGDGFDANEQFLYAGTKGKPRYEIVKINMETGDSPEVFVPQQSDVMAVTDVGHRTGIIAGKNVLYVLLRKIGDMQIIKVDYKTKAITLLPLTNKGAVADLSLLGDNDLVFASGGALRSGQYLRYDYLNDKLAALPFAEKFADFSATYSTKVIQVPSRDGKLIPVSLIYKKGINLQDNNALLIDAYGNGGASNDMFYDPMILPWLKHDGIYAYAHVRGGGELGDEWFKDGQYPNKMNSINDVVDVAEYFVKNNYSSSSKQLVMGGSAGSLIVGMSINQ
ncbi:MAG: prolyl oligopeptidase family serine peptidase, partial [Ferruginibacter sp.]